MANHRGRAHLSFSLVPLLLLTQSGCTTTTEALYTFEVRDEKHLINTERAKVVIVNSAAACNELEALLEPMRYQPDLEGLVLHLDVDICQMYAGKPHQISTVIDLDEQPSFATVVFTGYDEGRPEASLFACAQRSSTESVSLAIAPRSGYDINEAARSPTLANRCSD